MKYFVINPKTTYNPYNGFYSNLGYGEVPDEEFNPYQYLKCKDNSKLSDPEWVKKKRNKTREKARNLSKKRGRAEVHKFLLEGTHNCSIQKRGYSDSFYCYPLPLYRCGIYPTSNLWVSYCMKKTRKSLGLNPASSLISLICKRPMYVYGPIVLYQHKLNGEEYDGEPRFNFSYEHLTFLLQYTQQYQESLGLEKMKRQNERRDASRAYQTYLKDNHLDEEVQQRLQRVVMRDPTKWFIALKFIEEDELKRDKREDGEIDIEERMKRWG